jgi:hypothetical protein
MNGSHAHLLGNQGICKPSEGVRRKPWVRGHQVLQGHHCKRKIKGENTQTEDQEAGLQPALLPSKIKRGKGAPEGDH